MLQTKHILLIAQRDVSKPYLSYDVLYQLVHGECDVCVDVEQFTQRVLKDAGLEVTVQDVLDHVEEVRVVILWLYLTWMEVLFA